MKLFISILLAFFTSACAHKPQAEFFTLRLKPGQDVRLELEKFTQKKGIKAGSIVSSVGSLQQVALRFANQKEIHHQKGHFEVVSLSGTLSPDGPHIHLAVSDEKGKTWGGHLVAGNLVYTTLEIVVVESLQSQYFRRPDPQTTYQELVVEPRKNP